ncbi:MAG: hypothetical protein K2Y71_10975 [Xanthobacteraceae bacterium]|nr:hypothetical protein [Xanthobacteraceae bacterium]
MGKYEPLSDFLRQQAADEVSLSFEQIEQIIGNALPASAHEHRAWWSNNSTNSVMTRAWIDAGFRSEQVDMNARKLVFRRIRKQQSTNQRGLPNTSSATAHADHPIIGCMKGTLRIAPGVDLTDRRSQSGDSLLGVVENSDAVATGYVCGYLAGERRVDKRRKSVSIARGATSKRFDIHIADHSTRDWPLGCSWSIEPHDIATTLVRPFT